jgi:ABC-2 type transport system permease protein
MKHFLKLLSTFLKVNVQQALAYRTDAVLSILLNFLWLGWELVSLQIIFSNTVSLSGWGLGELIALLGVWRLANVVLAAVFWPNTERFNASLRDGTFDYLLLQPVNSQFLVSFSQVVVWRVWEVGLSAGLITVGIRLSQHLVTPSSLINFLALTLSGLAVLYSLWIVLLAITFWFVKFDNSFTILHALMDTGRFPATVYPAWLRLIVTFIIPIAIATTVPLQALRGELVWWQVLAFLGIGGLSLLISSLVWRTGVRHYSSASS